jgi:hypothetical protein
VEDLTYDPRLSEDAITAEDPPRGWEQVAAAPLQVFVEEQPVAEPQPIVQQYRRSHYLPSSSRMVAEDAPTASGQDAPDARGSLAPIMLDSTPPHAVDIWFAETPVRNLTVPGSRTTMRTQQPPMSRDAERGTRAAAFVGAFGAVAMAMFIWGVSAIAGTAPASNAASPAPAESWVIPVMNLPVLAKSAEAHASRAIR